MVGAPDHPAETDVHEYVGDHGRLLDDVGDAVPPFRLAEVARDYHEQHVGQEEHLKGQHLGYQEEERAEVSLVLVNEREHRLWQQALVAA